MRKSKAKNMARQKPSDHIETLKKQQAELAKKLKEAQTKARNDAKEFQRHKNELAGAVALKELEANPSGAFADALLGMLKHRLTRAADRELFGLPALPNEPKPAPEPAVKPFLIAEAGGGSEVGNG
jgi:threonine synthase